MISLISQKIKSSSLNYVLINILVAFVGFIKSFFFIRILSFEELGILTLVQTGVMLVGFSQIGLINGGYRIISLKKTSISEETNNVIYTYILIITLLFFLALIFIEIFFDLEFYELVILVCFFGLTTLIFNWVKNTLIANKSYGVLNFSNFLSSVLSLALMPLAYYFGVVGAVLVLFSYPLFFIILIFIKSPNLLPNKIEISLIKLKKILHFGFLPYLSGLLFLLYMQVERWSISFFLGPESLGKLYLVFIFSSVWILIPKSINDLYFPNAVLSFENNDYDRFVKILKINFVFIISYTLIFSLLTIFLFKYFVMFFFENHVQNLVYLYSFLPALFFRILCDPLSLFFNSVVELKPFVISDLSSLIFYIAIVLFFGLSFDYNLEISIILINLYFLIRLIILIYYFKKSKFYYVLFQN